MPAGNQLHRLSAAAAAMAVLALLAAPGAGGTPSVDPIPAPAPVQPQGERLSSPGLTRWAHPLVAETVRRSPARDAGALPPLRVLTEDGYPEVVALLNRWREPGGEVWLRVRTPARPRPVTGWVPAEALGPVNAVRTRLVVDRRRLRATLLRRGRAVWRSPIGVGAPGTPTPRGRFWIRERIRSTEPGGLYGPLAFGTSAYAKVSDWPGGGVVGLHGTNRPDLIPGRPSHGCIRVPNRAIRRLARLMPIGTPILIR